MQTPYVRNCSCGTCCKFERNIREHAYLLQSTKYENHNWNICANLKVVAILTEEWLHQILLFLCDWESRAKNQQNVVKEWSLRENVVPDLKNVVNELLVEQQKMYLPLQKNYDI